MKTENLEGNKKMTHIQKIADKLAKVVDAENAKAEARVKKTRVKKTPVKKASGPKKERKTGSALALARLDGLLPKKERALARLESKAESFLAAKAKKALEKSALASLGADLKRSAKAKKDPLGAKIAEAIADGSVSGLDSATKTAMAERLASEGFSAAAEPTPKPSKAKKAPKAVPAPKAAEKASDDLEAILQQARARSAADPKSTALLVLLLDPTIGAAVRLDPKAFEQAVRALAPKAKKARAKKAIAFTPGAPTLAEVTSWLVGTLDTGKRGGTNSSGKRGWLYCNLVNSEMVKTMAYAFGAEFVRQPEGSLPNCCYVDLSSL